MTDEDKVKFVTSFDACQRNVIQRILNPAYRVTESLEGWLMPWKTSMKQHLDIVNKFAFGVVEQRRLELANGGEYTDLLSRFMGAKNHRDQSLSDKELRDVILNFVVAGRDTTAQSISWTLYELFCNPGVKYKLLAEIKETITDEMETNAMDMYEAVKGMKYANAV
jgi:cytochrome P450